MTQITLKQLLIRHRSIAAALHAAQIGLEDACRAHRQKVFVSNRFYRQAALRQQGFHCGICRHSPRRLALFGRAVMVERQALRMHVGMGIGEHAENARQLLVISVHIGRRGRTANFFTRLVEQLVI